MSVLGASVGEAYDFFIFNGPKLGLSLLVLLGLVLLPVPECKRLRVPFLILGLGYLLVPTVFNYERIIHSPSFKNHLLTASARGLTEKQGAIEYLLVEEFGYRFPALASIKGFSDALIFSLAQTDTDSTWTNVIAQEGNSDILIVGIGESLRADHLGVYGYNRDTTPLLQKKKEVNVYRRAYSGGTNTWASIPAMLTKFSNRPDLAKSIVNLAKDAGYETYWLSNQTKVNAWDFSVSTIALQSDHTFFSSIDYSSDIQYDSILIKQLSKVLQSRDKHKKVLIILHFYGSHMTFGDRYPDDFDYFDGTHPLIDEYDNTVLYMDSILANIIDLSAENSAKFMFFADHGLVWEEGSYSLKHDVRKVPSVDSVHVPLITNIPLSVGHDKLINLFYYECLFSDWSGIKANELDDTYCSKVMSEDQVVFYDANLNLHKIAQTTLK